MLECVNKCARLLSSILPFTFPVYSSLFIVFSCSMQSQLNWIVISMYIGIANMLYIFQIKCILKTNNNKKTKKNTKILIIKAGCDTFNRFHSPVIVHRKHEGAVTRQEFLPSSAKKHLQFKGGYRPRPSAYRFFISGYATAFTEHTCGLKSI